MPNDLQFGAPVETAVSPSRGFVVAIPARDEEERLPACLRALSQQHDLCGHKISPNSVRVVLFANNCTDQTASLTRSLGVCWGLDIRIFEDTPPMEAAHAGAARRIAMDHAERWLAETGEVSGVIMTTDADSQVAPDWVVRNLAAIEAGADAVLGRIELDDEGKLLPQPQHRRGKLEDTYEKLLAELSGRLDPVDCNPWPHHTTISGASLAIAREAYLAVGRLPAIPLGEDKALVASLARRDARIRYCPNVLTITSGRTHGRAPGGVADTLRLRADDPRALCDEALEPFDVAWARAFWRGRMRRLHGIGLLWETAVWADALAIPKGAADTLCRGAAFGSLWSAIETMSPVLARHPLRPSQLPAEIKVAKRVLSRLRTGSLCAGHDVKTEESKALGPKDDADVSHLLDEQADGLVGA
jgi:cellulose synthase/poly-beta-1,6-N-acetylglucosamine synthase-like glycosyltransferase